MDSVSDELPILTHSNGVCPVTNAECLTASGGADLRKQIDVWKRRCEAKDAACDEIASNLGSSLHYSDGAVRVMLAKIKCAK